MYVGAFVVGPQPVIYVTGESISRNVDDFIKNIRPSNSDERVVGFSCPPTWFNIMPFTSFTNTNIRLGMVTTMRMRTQDPSSYGRRQYGVGDGGVVFVDADQSIIARNVRVPEHSVGIMECDWRMASLVPFGLHSFSHSLRVCLWVASQPSNTSPD